MNADADLLAALRLLAADDDRHTFAWRVGIGPDSPDTWHRLFLPPAASEGFAGRARAAGLMAGEPERVDCLLVPVDTMY